MLTENEVARTWSGLFKNSEFTNATITKAEDLLEELRAESPLLHRLSTELEELRGLCKETAG